MRFLIFGVIITMLSYSQIYVVNSKNPVQPVSLGKPALTGGSANVTLTVTSDKVTYKPLENVTITANIINQESYEIDNVTVKTAITDAFGEKELYTENETITSITAYGNVSVQTIWTAPSIMMAGFVAEVSVFDNQSVLLASGYWVFDVVEDWTKVPRYGFFSTPAFSPIATGSAEKVEALKLLHINSLQFYDWFELHGNYTPTKSTYYLLGRKMSRDKVIEIINLAHSAGMKCMPYTTIYSAAQEVYSQHTDWGLNDYQGNPLKFVNWLYFMNPDTPCGWHDYLIDEFLDSIAMFNWDGIHLDQYGEGWTSNAYWNGERVNMVDAFQHFINDAVGNITQTYPEGKLIFNYVTYWPACYEMMGKRTALSALYVEVWDPYTGYSDIRYLIRQGKEYNNSKAVILAAYPTPSPPLPTVLLLDAEIFASQGFHIELGEGNGILTDPYFPSYSTMNETMIKALRSYYETITRYEQYIYDAAVQELSISTVKVTGYPYSISPSANSIQTIPYARVVNGSEEERIIHFINFRGVTNMNWKDAKSVPTELSGVPVEVQIPSEKMKELKGVYLINPDSLNTDPTALSFTVNVTTSTIKFSLPSLKYWDIIIIRYGEPDTTDPVADAGPDQTVEAGIVTFNGSGSTDNIVVASYFWDFGDGTNGTGMIATHTYANPGNYTAALNVSDAAGNWDIDTAEITVLAAEPPVADAGSDQTVNEDTLVTFNGSGSWDNFGVTSYTWTFTDVTLQTLTGVMPNYTFATPGIYTVTLNVSDAAGHWDTDTVIITVLDVTAPVADAGNNQTVKVGETVTFNASLSTDNVGIVSYTWDFGDGNTTTVTSPIVYHAYNAIGNYTVTLTVMDAAGNGATDTVTVAVTAEAGGVFLWWIVGGAAAVVVLVAVWVYIVKVRKPRVHNP